MTIKLDTRVGPLRQTAHELVRETLRRAILRGSLPGGTRLVQAEIAQQLQVSTTPVREALRDLATEGLIRLDAHRGAIVHELSYAEICDVHDLCKLLEPEAMRRAASDMSAQLVERATALADAMAEEQDVGEWTALNREFHATLAEGIGSPRLRATLRGLRDSAAPYVGLSLQARPEEIQTSNADHRELLDALTSGDGELAADIATRHLDLTIKNLESVRHLFLGGQADGEAAAT